MDLYGSKKALSELSQLYVQMNSQEVEEGYKEIDKKKETAMYRRAGNLARTSLSSKGKKKEDAQNKSAKIVSAITRQKENERFDRIGKDPKHQNNYKESLDPVGQEDADVDNDGKKNTKSDKYLMKRRKAIGKAIGTRKEEVEITEIHGQAHKPHEVPGTNLKGLVKKAVKRIDTDVDGDTDKNDKAKGELGEFIPGVGNKRLYSTTGTKTAKESFSNWRSDLREVIDTDEQDKQIKEKKVKNKVVIDPDLKLEAIAHELGAEIVEVIELDEGSLKPGETYMQYAKRKEAEKKDTRMTVTAADKKANTPAYQKYKAGDKRYKSADHMKEEVEFWCELLVDEGYDLSEFTWDEMYEEYELMDEGIRSAIKSLVSGKKKEAPAKPMSRGEQLRKKYNVGPEKSDTSAKRQILNRSRARAE